MISEEILKYWTNAIRDLDGQVCNYRIEANGQDCRFAEAFCADLRVCLSRFRARIQSQRAAQTEEANQPTLFEVKPTPYFPDPLRHGAFQVRHD